MSSVETTEEPAHSSGPSHERVQELFLAAADLGDPEQQLFLDKECGDDRALRAAVLSLLAADRQEGALLDRGVADVAGAVLSGSLPPGQRIGAYRVLRLLGEGGM